MGTVDIDHVLSLLLLLLLLLCLYRETGSNSSKDIFMYDISTRKVSRLRGEFSSAFVEVAESNTNSQEEDVQAAASDIFEQSSLDFQTGEEPIGDGSEIHEQIIVLNKGAQKSPSYTSQKALIFDDEGELTTEQNMASSEINEGSTKNKISNAILVSSGYSKTSDFTAPSL